MDEKQNVETTDLNECANWTPKRVYPPWGNSYDNNYGKVCDEVCDEVCDNDPRLAQSDCCEKEESPRKLLVFYVDVGSLEPAKAEQFIERFKANYMPKNLGNRVETMVWPSHNQMNHVEVVDLR